MGYFAIDSNTKDKEEQDWDIDENGDFKPAVTYAIKQSQAFDLMPYDEANYPKGANIYEVQLEDYKFKNLTDIISKYSFNEFDVKNLYIKKDNLTYYPIITYYANKYKTEYPALCENIEKAVEDFNKDNNTEYVVNYYSANILNFYLE